MAESSNADTLDDTLLAALGALDTPTVCNALELIEPARTGYGFTSDALLCLYPDLTPVVAYARTATIRSVQPSSLAPADKGVLTMGYYTHIAEGGPLPSIAVIQDLDGSRAGFGAFWGEVNSHIHAGLGCRGVVTDGSVRDVDGNAPGFQVLCAKVVPSHAHYHLVDYGKPVSVAGMYVSDGDLIHADRHGAVVIPRALAARVPETADLLARREAVILAAAKAPGFDIATLRRVIGEARNIH